VESGEEARVVLRAAGLSYVRGVLRPAGELKPEDYYIHYPSGFLPVDTCVHYNTQTGEFVYGPLLAGQATLRVSERSADRQRAAEVLAKEVTVPSGHVVTTQLTPPRAVPPLDDKGGRGHRRLTTDYFAARGGSEISGTAFLSDGTTPAFGARVAVFLPGPWQPLVGGLVDAAGRIHWHALWTSDPGPDPQPPGSPSQPVAVVSLPGRCGAAIIPLKKGTTEFRAVLPPPVSLRGHVAVGGRSVTGLKARFRVLAAFQGKGKLNGALSIEANAQDDGSFELAGLTPGSYQVQAAMDDIWLSKCARLEVGGKPLAPLVLDVPAPGAPVVVRLVDGNGRPMAREEAAIERPAGPLQARLWPKTLRSDGAGRIVLEGLEHGEHKLTLTGTGTAHAVRIPRPGDGPAVPSQILIRAQADTPEHR